MVKLKHSVVWLVFACVFYSGYSFAKSTSKPKPKPKPKSKSLKVLVPLAPPHIFKDGSGRVADAVKAVFKECKMDMKFEVLPFGGHWRDYKKGKGDAIVSSVTPPFKLGGKKNNTKSIIALRDGLTVLKKSGLQKISKIDELTSKHKVIGFEGASKVLGFDKYVKKFGKYQEKGNQRVQVNLLFMDRVHVVVADGLIISDHIMNAREEKKNKKKLAFDPNVNVVFNPVFSKNAWNVVFRDSKFVPKFDGCYDKLKSKNVIENIGKKYVDKYRDIVGNNYPNSL